MKKTYVIDNGQEYSSHAVYFVEADPAVAEPILSAMTAARPESARWWQGWHKVLLSAESVKWWCGRAKTLPEWLRLVDSDMESEVEAADAEAAREFVRLARAALPGFGEGRRVVQVEGAAP